jgi:plastocyanin
MRRRSRLFPFAACLAVCAASVAGCGGGDDDDGSSGRTVTVTDGKITVDAEDVRFDVGTIDATAGPLDVTLVEKGSLDHTFVVEDSDGNTVDGTLAVSASKDQDSGTYELEPGDYDFYCDIPGHRGQGMEGTIVVE